MKTLLPSLVLAGALAAAQTAPEAAIIDSGSTNIPGMTVSMPAKGHVLVEHARGGPKAHMNLNAELKTRFMKDLEAAAPVDQLAVRHCAKSASFGTRVYVEYKGVRSPDISCPGQTDPKVDALHTDVEEIMAEARKAK